MFFELQLEFWTVDSLSLTLSHLCLWWVSPSVFLWCLLPLILWGDLFVLFPYIWAVCHWQWVAKKTPSQWSSKHTKRIVTPFLTFMFFQKYYMPINGSSFSQEVLAFSVLVYNNTLLFTLWQTHTHIPTLIYFAEALLNQLQSSIHFMLIYYIFILF